MSEPSCCKRRVWAIGLLAGMIVALTVAAPAAVTMPGLLVDAPGLLVDQVQALGAEDYAVRQAAVMALRDAGPKATAALVQGTASRDPELALRATQLLGELYVRPELPDYEPVEAALQMLSQRPGAIGEAARLAWDTSTGVRERRVIARLEGLGARIQYADTTMIRDLELEEQGIPQIAYVVISRKWTGGDDGLKLLTRLSRVDLVYRVKGTKVSEEAFKKLEEIGYRIDERGAYLGMGPGTDPLGGLPNKCLVGRVADKSPAQQAGLRAGDVILKFNDQDLTGFDSLIDLLKQTEPGAKATLTVRRGGEFGGPGEELKLNVTLGDW